MKPEHKEILIRELEEVYSLIETSRLALRYEATSDGECIADALNIANFKLFEKIEMLKGGEA